MTDTTDTENSDSNDEWAAAMSEQAVVESTAKTESTESVENAGVDDWGAALEEQAQEEIAVNQASMPALTPEESGPSMEDANLDVILDIPVSISMDVGSTKISIRNLLKLNQGSVVELDRLAGEPLDVLVNGMLIAHGEVVVVNEKYGIRLTDVISAAERIQKLK
jgi:flagellar motor switch protein FliN/FliY